MVNASLLSSKKATSRPKTASTNTSYEARTNSTNPYFGVSNTDSHEGTSLNKVLAQTGSAPFKSSYQGSIGMVTPPLEVELQSDDGMIPVRNDVEAIFKSAGLIQSSTKPPPEHAGDSSHLHKNGSAGLWADIKTLGPRDVTTVRNIVAAKASGKPQDDRKMHMEQTMQLVAALPPTSTHRVKLTTSFLDELWTSLPHPPSSYLGDDRKYRSGDGRNNSYMYPMLGAANTPYARSVNPQVIQPAALPDPGLIFDSVLARETFRENPNQISSILFSWATLIIHDLFQTDHEDSAISKTSSYLDLSILYGDNQEEQDMMRTFKDGKIKPDCFAEERLLMFPPSCGVLLIMFNRFHNHVVENLAAINEGGRFDKPVPDLRGAAHEKAWRKHDNDLFQTGRLITGGLYVNIIPYDCLRTIVGLNRTNSTWSLDPRRDNGKQSAGDNAPRGMGNQVSAEFNLSYRWHSCIGQADEKWTEAMFFKLFGKPSAEVSIQELMIGLGKYDHELSKDPNARPFAGLRRRADGKYDDGELAKIFVEGVEQVSGAFGARNIPKAIKAITILGIQQSRAWNMCTLNEYRKFFGLKTYTTFNEVNSDPYVAEQSSICMDILITLSYTQV